MYNIHCMNNIAKVGTDRLAEGYRFVDGLDEAGRPTLVSRSAHLAYPVHDGVPILLVHEASRVPAPGPDPQG